MSKKTKSCQFLANFDVTGELAANKINYRGNDKYQTAVGGCCSLIAYFVILALILDAIYTVGTFSKFNQTVNLNQINDDNEGFLVNQDQAVPAINIVVEGSDFNITDYWNV